MTAVALVLAFVPPDDEPNNTLAVFKIAGLTLLLVVGGLAAYWRSARRSA